MTPYSAIAGQSIYDVVTQTYGTIDELLKLVQDSGVSNLDAPVTSGRAFTYDETVLTDQALNVLFRQTGIFYATDVSNYGNVYSATRSSGTPVVPTVPPYIPPVTPPTHTDMTLSTHYTSGADGTTVIALTDETGHPITGATIVQIELEIKPLTPSQFVWNSSTSILTLQPGTQVDSGQTLFVIYSITV